MGSCAGTIISRLRVSKLWAVLHWRLQFAAMSSVYKLAAVAALLLIGPAMYVVSRAHSLSYAFSRVGIGDSASAVTASMGKPQSEARTNLHLRAEVEYRYRVWPIPRLWVVGLRDGKVVEKAEVAAP
jgi:hypothetical protein